MGMGMAEILREVCGNGDRCCGNTVGTEIGAVGMPRGWNLFFAGTVTMLVNCGTVVSKVLLRHTVYGEGTEHNIDGGGWRWNDAGIAASKH